ncbi:hypothetical protein ACOME3_001296 [Neoechinorhynchus agilis]
MLGEYSEDCDYQLECEPEQIEDSNEEIADNLYGKESDFSPTAEIAFESPEFEGLSESRSAGPISSRRICKVQGPPKNRVRKIKAGQDSLCPNREQRKVVCSKPQRVQPISRQRNTQGSFSAQLPKMSTKSSANRKVACTPRESYDSDTEKITAEEQATQSQPFRQIPTTSYIHPTIEICFEPNLLEKMTDWSVDKPRSVHQPQTYRDAISKEFHGKRVQPKPLFPQKDSRHLIYHQQIRKEPEHQERITPKTVCDQSVRQSLATCPLCGANIFDQSSSIGREKAKCPTRLASELKKIIHLRPFNKGNFDEINQSQRCVKCGKSGA